MSTHTEHIFDRARLLLGTTGMQHLADTHVIIFGVGGVGSWCAEGLVRSGLGHLTMVDSDCVCDSNVNRQLMATTATIGRSKVEAMRRHLLEINPGADIIALHQRYTADTADSFDLDSYDFVIDCIDSVADKALLILRATASRAVLLSSMGAALRIDPAKIHMAEFWRVKGCPLARALRQRFKRSGVYPARKFMCVYSDEQPLPNHTDGLEAAEGRQPNGSLVHITSIFGMNLAAQVIRASTKA